MTREQDHHDATPHDPDADANAAAAAPDQAPDVSPREEQLGQRDDLPPDSPTASFIHTARRLGPVVGLLAILSLSLPGILGTTLLVFTTANAGSPSNFHDPDADRYHRLLGTWDAADSDQPLLIPEPVWPEDAFYPELVRQAVEDAAAERSVSPGEIQVAGADQLGQPIAVAFGEPTAFRFAIEPVVQEDADADRPAVNAVRAVPLRIDTPPDLDRDDWQPYGVVVVSPQQRQLLLEPAPEYARALPTLSLELRSDPDDPHLDTFVGNAKLASAASATRVESAADADADADASANAAPGQISFTAERRVPPVQSLQLALGLPLAAVVVALLFAVCTGSAILPTYALSFAAGVFFGPAYGSAIAMIGVTGGALVGYAWGVALARRRVSAVIDENPRAHVVRAAIIDKPLHLETFAVILLRFPPNSPFALTNLVMSSVGVRLLPYTLGTFIGIAPRTLLAVFLGVAIGSIADAQSAGGLLRVIVGVVIGVAVFVYAYKVLSKWARDALAEQTGGAVHPDSPALKEA